MNSFRQYPADLQHRTGAIVLAAGSGTRFGAQKQFLHLSGNERLVDRAVATAAAVADWVVVVLPEEVEWVGDAVYASCAGGIDRLGSVLNGLGRLPQEAEFVLIHDAAHPLATPRLARSMLAALTETHDPPIAGAVPVLDAVDVVKRIRPNGALETVGRAMLGSAQVPMAFHRRTLQEAHRLRSSAEQHAPVEDSALLESHGHRVIAVPGEVTNIHVVDEASLRAVRVLYEHAL